MHTKTQILTFIILTSMFAHCRRSTNSSKEKCGNSKFYEPQIREYWISVEEVDWDYAPMGKDNIMGKSFTEDQNVFVKNGKNRIGSKYIKALYIEHTPEFKSHKEITKEKEHLGFVGPVIKAVVGDTIKVHFKNNGKRPYTMHPHGVNYDKENEGFNYNDNSKGPYDQGNVKPGKVVVYTWEADEASGPAKNDFSSVLWAYHSHIDVPRDIYTGLVGPIVIVNPKYITNEEEAINMKPCDIDREFYAYYSVTNENESYLLEKNLKKMENYDDLDDEDIDELLEDEDFEESNLMHGINGYLYGNLPGIIMKKGEKVRWYLFSYGTEVDLHTVHWHGSTVVTPEGFRKDSIGLKPALFTIADMDAQSVGTWIFNCHVHDHIDAGMIHLYTIEK